MKRERTDTLRRAFTLIELLIVVAIIAILAAIAVPNLIDAQTRSKVVRVMADMRTLINALESYHIDNGSYLNVYYPNEPPDPEIQMRGSFLKIEADGEDPGFGAGPAGINSRHAGNQLTTPVAYISSIPTDPFWTDYLNAFLGPVNFKEVGEFYWGTGAKSDSVQMKDWGQREVNYMFQCPGPDLIIYNHHLQPFYDPTNGAISPGDIWYYAPFNFGGGGYDPGPAMPRGEEVGPYPI